MAIIGFNIKKIEATRNKTSGKGIKIKNDVQIKEVKDVSMKLGTANQKALFVAFKYEVDYDPNVGKIIIEGDVLDLRSEKETTEIIEKWKKDKQLDEKIAVPILNYILSKTNIEAIMLSDRMNLPSPVPLPKITKKKK